MHAVQADFLPLSLSLFSTAVGQSRVLEHATAISVDAVVDQEGSLEREGKPFSTSRRARLVVQRSDNPPAPSAQQRYTC